MKPLRAILPVVLAALLVGCSDDPLGSDEDGNGDLELGACELDEEFLVDTGIGRDAIPALTDPPWARPGDPTVTNYLADADRVVGIVVDGDAYAVPHNILWWHEIANLNFSTADGTLRLAVTYCPLTGSALVFDRAGAADEELGVSGLLYMSNLVMYDRGTGESLWPQMFGEARCGRDRGAVLPRYPSVEMTWSGWTSLHPETAVVGVEGSGDPYFRYPYGDYEEVDGFDFPMPEMDGRRSPKERVLGVPGVEGALIAFPFGALEIQGAWAVVPFAFPESGREGVVLWDGARRAAVAFVAEAGGEPVTLVPRAEGIFDEETGSRWTVEGRAVEGPLAGLALEPVEEAYVAFWGVWASFFPSTELWAPGRPPPPEGQSGS